MNEINDFSWVKSVREFLIDYPDLEEKYKDAPEWFQDFRFTKEMMQDISAYHELTVGDILEIWRNGPDLSKNDFCVRGVPITFKNETRLCFYIYYPETKKFRTINGTDIMDYRDEADIRKYLEEFYAE